MDHQLPSSAASNVDCKVNQGIIGLVMTWILLAVGILTVTLRAYVRLFVRRNFGWDDYMAAASLVRKILSKIPYSDYPPSL